MWAGTNLHTMVCYWARGNSPQASRTNAEAYTDVAERIAAGLRTMTPDEADLCAID